MGKGVLEMVLARREEAMRERGATSGSMEGPKGQQRQR